MAVIRLLLAGCLTTALLAASIPVIETTQDATAHSRATDQLHTIQTTITALRTENEPVHPTNPGATRDITVDIPATGPGTTRITWIAIGGIPGSDPPDGPHNDILAYHLEGGPTKVIRTAIDIRIVDTGTRQSDSTPLLITDRRHLSFTLITLDDTPTIQVQAIRF